MIFTPQQIRAIRQRKQTAVLAPRTERIRAGSVRVLRRCEVTAAIARRPARSGPSREVSAWIEARLDLDPAVETVCDITPDGEIVAVVFTVLAVEDVALEALTLGHARACGFRTAGECRAAWLAEHPRSDRVRLVFFALGDVRDQPLLLSKGWPDYTIDPSRAMRGEPEPVSRGEQMRLAGDARQRYLRFQADRGSAAQRLAAIQRGALAAPAGRATVRRV
jgi:hypothetical protein